LQTPSDSLPPEIVLTEYEAPTDRESSRVLFGLSDHLGPYLQRGWLTRAFENGEPCIKASHYVGLLPYVHEATPHLLLITPKGSGANPDLGLLRFLELIALASGDEEFEAPTGLEGRKGTSRFVLFLAAYYGQLLQQLCRGDFRSYYRDEQGELRSRVRGRLHLQGYARNCLRGQSHRLPCRWEEFTPDNWDNRILWAAARGLQRAAQCLDTEAFNSVRRCFSPVISWFEPVSEEPVTSSDFHRARLGRISPYYRRALLWARMIIQGTDLPTAGGSTPPLAFNAHATFEHFAEAVTRSAMPTPAFRPMFQEPYPFLTGPQDQKHKSDIIILSSDGIHAVGDAKYKEVIESIPAEQTASLPEVVHSAIRSPDWNQLYVHMRLTGASRGFFIVPFWEKEGETSVLIAGYEFAKSPLDGPVRVAVLGLNLMQPIRVVKQDAARHLKDWLQEERWAKPTLPASRSGPGVAETV